VDVGQRQLRCFGAAGHPYTQVVTGSLLRDKHVLMIQAAIGWCIGGLGPVLVLGARDLDVPRYQLSWLGSAFGFGLLGAGLLGRRILSHGVEPVTRIGAVLVAVGVVLLGFGNSVPLLAGGGLLQGAGCSAFLIATPALIGIDDRARRLAIAVGASSIAALIAPGAVSLSDQGLSTGRIALFIPVVWLIPIALRRLRAPEGIGIDRPVTKAGADAGSMSPDTWRRWLVIVLAVSAEFCFWTWGAARLVDAGAAEDTASGLVVAFAIGMALGRIIGPRSLRSLNPVHLSAIGATAAALIVMLNVPMPALVAALFFAGLAVAVLYPVSLARLLDDPGLPEERLIALAAYASGVAITITPTLLGLLDQVMALQFAFGLVPILVAGMVWLHQRVAEPV
jgi:MFS family permease